MAPRAVVWYGVVGDVGSLAPSAPLPAVVSPNVSNALKCVFFSSQNVLRVEFKIEGDMQVTLYCKSQK